MSYIGPLLAAAAALFAAALFATLREALENCSPSHILEELPPGNASQRARLEVILPKSARLTTTAGLLEVLCALGFVFLLLRAAGLDRLDDSLINSKPVITAAILAVPILLIVTRLLPPAINRAKGESLLAAVLPGFYRLDRLATPIVWPLDLVRQATLRIFGLQEEDAATRILVEDLRDVIEDTGLDTALPDSGLELIENVMDFHDVDVAAVMTPRTEVEALDATASTDDLLRTIASSRHSRIPIFDETIDAVVGWISARDVIRRLNAGDFNGADLRDIARPVKFVPETKKIPDLLDEFRSERFKLAIVLDEYGGTAGLVTIGDVLGELVGELHDEFDPAGEEPGIRRVSPSLFDVPGAEHVTDVNQILDINLPEEDDFETIAGFILARLGRFPAVGESFTADGIEYTISEATDRRILWIRVRLAA